MRGSHWHLILRCNTPTFPTLGPRFTPSKAFTFPVDAQNSVTLSFFDRDSLRLSQAKKREGGMGLEDGGVDKILHQSAVAVQLLAYDPVVCSLIRTCTAQTQCLHIFLIVLCDMFSY